MKQGLLEIKLSLLLKKRSNIKEYNLSGSAWKDYYSSKEREKMYSKSEHASLKKSAIDEEIREVIKSLLETGYSEEELYKKYPSIELFGIYIEKGENKRHL